MAGAGGSVEAGLKKGKDSGDKTTKTKGNSEHRGTSETTQLSEPGDIPSAQSHYAKTQSEGTRNDQSKGSSFAAWVAGQISGKGELIVEATDDQRQNAAAKRLIEANQRIYASNDTHEQKQARLAQTVLDIKTDMQKAGDGSKGGRVLDQAKEELKGAGDAVKRAVGK